MTDREKKLTFLLATSPHLCLAENCTYIGAAKDLIANGVTVQEQNGCEHCRTASYTENPFTVITQMGREVKTQFNFCPNCGARMEG